jgi:RHS repeat-associated protein
MTVIATSFKTISQKFSRIARFGALILAFCISPTLHAADLIFSGYCFQPWTIGLGIYGWTSYVTVKDPLGRTFSGVMNSVTGYEMVVSGAVSGQYEVWFTWPYAPSSQIFLGASVRSQQYVPTGSLDAYGHLQFALTHKSIATFPSLSGGSWGNSGLHTIPGTHYFFNYGKTTPPEPPRKPLKFPDDDDSRPVSCGEKGKISGGTSIVDNDRLVHIHTVDDYALSDAGGCTPCGGAVSSESRTAMPGFKLQRIHRYLDMNRHGSFGPGVFTNFDAQISIGQRFIPMAQIGLDSLSFIGTRPPIFHLWDPTTGGETILRASLSAGNTWGDREQWTIQTSGWTSDRKQVRSTRILDSANQPVAMTPVFSYSGWRTPLNQSSEGGGATIFHPPVPVDVYAPPFDLTGKKIEITWEDGGIDTFECISPHGTSAPTHARLIKRLDEVGNGCAIAYAYQANASPSTLGYEPQRLWSMSTITDPYGASASCTYGYADGQPVLTSVSCPNGSSVSYAYGTSTLVGLDRVTLPDGAVGNFTTVYNPLTGSQIVTYQDPAGEGVHRNKSVAYTGSFWMMGGQRYVVAPNLVQSVVNGAGELVYMNWWEIKDITLPNGTVSNQHLYVYEGGGNATGSLFGEGYSIVNGRVMRRDYQADKVVSIAAFSSYSMVSEPSTWGEYLQTGFTKDVLGRVTGMSQGSAITETYVRDDAGRVNSHSTVSDGVTVSESTTRTGIGKPALETDGAGRQTLNLYDIARPWLCTKTTRGYGSADAASWQWSYTPRGLLAQAKDPYLFATDYAYDAAGRLLSITEPPDVTGGPRAARVYTYDGAGRVATSTYGGTQAVQYQYDERNRVIKITYGDGTWEGKTYVRTGVDANLLREYRDRNGNTTTFLYDGAGRIVSEETVNAGDQMIAQKTLRTYLPGTPLAASVTADASVSITAYDEQKRIVKISYPRFVGDTKEGGMPVETYAYDAADRVVKHVSRSGCATYTRYGAQGLPTQVVTETIPGTAVEPFARQSGANPGYQIADYSYDNAGNLLVEVDPSGVVSSRSYDGQGRLVAQVAADSKNGVLLPEAQRTVHALDLLGHATTTWLPRSFARSGGVWSTVATPQKTLRTFTGRGRLSSETQAAGTADAATRLLSYTLTGQVASVSDRRDSTWLTIIGYSPCCDRIVSVQDAAGNVMTFGYDGNGNRISEIDANGVGVIRTFDALGCIRTETNMAGEQRRFAYDAWNGSAGMQSLLNLLPDSSARSGFTTYASITTPSGMTNGVLSDSQGRPLIALDAVGRQTRWTYGDETSGLRTAVTTSSNGQQTTVRTDGVGRTRSVTMPSGSTMSSSYDARGTMIGQVDGNGVGFTQVIDGLGRPVARTDTGGATTSSAYDAGNNLVRSTDALGKVSTGVYTLRNQLKSWTDALLAVTGYTYDAAGNLLTQVDAEARTTSYAYDRRGLRVSETYPGASGGTVTTAFDAGGRASTRADQQVTTTFIYNAANRLSERRYTTAAADTFAYDVEGRLTQATSGAYGTRIDRAYAASGSLATETLSADGESWQMRSESDLLGRVQRRVLPDGTDARFTYSPAGALATLALDGTVLATRGTDGMGRRTTTGFANGVQETWTWKTGENLLQSIAGGATVAATYGYDARKQVTSAVDAVSANNQASIYDDAARLKEWRRAAPAQDTRLWTLSTVGDWSSVSTNGVAQARTHSPVHEVTAVAGTALSYDARGNLTRDEANRTFVWDARNQLATATVAGSPTTYRYDALGRRVIRKVGTLRTVWTLAGDQEAWSETLDPVARDAWKAPTAPTPVGAAQSLPEGAIQDAVGTKRITFQPAASRTTAGWQVDAGTAYNVQASGLSFGWRGSPQPFTVDREWLGWPLYDTYNRLRPTPAQGGIWECALPNGTYPVVIVCGDAHSNAQTNHLLVEGVAVRDPSPYDPLATPGYNLGSFDGYALSITVSDGKLSIEGASDAVDPKLCFVEIEPKDGVIDAATQARLATFVAQATAQTATGRPDNVKPLRIVALHGDYVDERLVERTRHGTGPYAITKTRSLHHNRQYSVIAITNEAGAVTERYRYDPFGVRTALAPDGIAVRSAAIEDTDTGFTGRDLDQDSGLMYFRHRWYSPRLGRFVNRDPAGYVDGLSLYAGYFAPNGLDPYGLEEYVDKRPVLVIPTPAPIEVVPDGIPQMVPWDPRKSPKITIGIEPVTVGNPWFLRPTPSNSLAHQMNEPIYTATGNMMLGALPFPRFKPWWPSNPKVPAMVKECINTPKVPLPEGVSGNINWPRQKLHIPDLELTVGRSPLFVDPQALLDGLHAGKYPIIRLNPRGQPVVDFGTPIGQYVTQSGSFPTQYGTVHFGQNGVHIVPANPYQF